MIHRGLIACILAVFAAPIAASAQSLPSSYPEHVQSVCDVSWKELNRTAPRQTMDQIRSRMVQKDVCKCMLEYQSEAEANRSNLSSRTPREVYDAAKKYSLSEMSEDYRLTYRSLNSMIALSFPICLEDPNAGAEQQEAKRKEELQRKRFEDGAPERARIEKEQLVESCNAERRRQASQSGLIGTGSFNPNLRERCRSIGIEVSRTPQGQRSGRGRCEGLSNATAGC